VDKNDGGGSGHQEKKSPGPNQASASSKDDEAAWMGFLLLEKAWPGHELESFSLSFFMATR
jgi:hypothetical protein